MNEYIKIEDFIELYKDKLEYKEFCKAIEPYAYDIINKYHVFDMYILVNNILNIDIKLNNNIHLSIKLTLYKNNNIKIIPYGLIGEFSTEEIFLLIHNNNQFKKPLKSLDELNNFINHISKYINPLTIESAELLLIDLETERTLANI